MNYIFPNYTSEQNISFFIYKQEYIHWTGELGENN